MRPVRLALLLLVPLGALAVAPAPGCSEGDGGGAGGTGGAGGECERHSDCPVAFPWCTGGAAARCQQCLEDRHCEAGETCDASDGTCGAGGAGGTGGAGGATCTFFPDSCPEPAQCFANSSPPPERVCTAPGAHAQGEACDGSTGDRQDFCGRELLCVRYSSPTTGDETLCSPLCTGDAHCVAAGVNSPCTALGDLKFCPLR